MIDGRLIIWEKIQPTNTYISDTCGSKSNTPKLRKSFNEEKIRCARFIFDADWDEYYVGYHDIIQSNRNV